MSESPNKANSHVKSTIESLKLQTEKLKEQLYLDAISQPQIGVESEITQLQKQGDKFAKKIENETKKINELDEKLSEMTAKLRGQRESTGDGLRFKASNEVISKKIKGLETKLDKSLKRYNEVVAHNKQLREQIDRIRRERVVYDGIYKHLEEELESSKEEMKSVVKKTKSSIEKLEKAQEKLESLQASTCTTEKEFREGWDELGKSIENELKEREEPPPVGSVPPEYCNLKQQVQVTNSQISQDQKQIANYLEQVEAYESTLKKIEESTGIHDIDELLRTFLDSEKQNAGLSQQVNILTSEIDLLQSDVDDIKTQIEKTKKSGVVHETTRQKELKELELRLKRTENRAVEEETLYNQNCEMLQSLGKDIEELFRTCGCVFQPRENEYDGLNEKNILLYMGKIEDKASELIHQFTSLQIRKSGNVSLDTLKPRGKKGKINIDAPCLPEKEAEDDEPTFPLSLAEMRSRIEQKLKK